MPKPLVVAIDLLLWIFYVVVAVRLLVRDRQRDKELQELKVDVEFLLKQMDTPERLQEVTAEQWIEYARWQVAALKEKDGR